MTTPTDAAIARVYEQYPLMAAAVGRERIEAIVQVAIEGVIEQCAKVAETGMICRNKVGRDGSISQQCRTPTAKEIANAIRSLNR